MDGVQLPQGYSHFEEAVYFLPLMPWRLKLPLGSYMGSPVFLTSEIDQMSTRNFRELSG